MRDSVDKLMKELEPFIPQNVYFLVLCAMERAYIKGQMDEYRSELESTKNEY